MPSSTLPKKQRNRLVLSASLLLLFAFLLNGLGVLVKSRDRSESDAARKLKVWVRHLPSTLSIPDIPETDIGFPWGLIYASLPAVSAQINHSSSFKNWKFTLQSDARFENGDSITRNAIIESWKKSAEKHSQTAQLLQALQPASLNPSVLEFEFPSAVQNFPDQLDQTTHLISHPSGSIIASGEYRVSRFKRGMLRLVRRTPSPERVQIYEIITGPVPIPSADLIEAAPDGPSTPPTQRHQLFGGIWRISENVAWNGKNFMQRGFESLRLIQSKE